MTRRNNSPSYRLRGGKSSRFRREARIRLAEAQNWRCAHCGCTLEIETATTDHVVPLSKGGTNYWLNKVASCGPCNVAKANKGSGWHRRTSAPLTPPPSSVSPQGAEQ